jgi:hypothetical protein
MLTKAWGLLLRMGLRLCCGHTFLGRDPIISSRDFSRSDDMLDVGVWLWVVGCGLWLCVGVSSNVFLPSISSSS